MTLRTEFFIVFLIVLVFSLLMSFDGLSSLLITGLDPAHNILDGIFFRDFLLDFPVTQPKEYVYDYYRQYPALGFLFWPPFFPFVEGIVMLIAGVNLFSAHIAIVVFSIVWGLSFYYIARMSLTFSASIAGVIFTMSAPIMFPFYNQVMREVPVVAMMSLTLLGHL